jgi:hypothetical protein
MTRSDPEATKIGGLLIATTTTIATIDMAATTVDAKSTPHAMHTASQISWLNTRGPSVRIQKRVSQFSLKITKDEKRLDKTWNLPGGTRQFRIYNYKASQNDI